VGLVKKSHLSSSRHAKSVVAGEASRLFNGLSGKEIFRSAQNDRRERHFQQLHCPYVIAARPSPGTEFVLAVGFGAHVLGVAVYGGLLAHSRSKRAIYAYGA